MAILFLYVHLEKVHTFDTMEMLWTGQSRYF